MLTVWEYDCTLLLLNATWAAEAQQTEHIEGLATVKDRCRMFQTAWETLAGAFQSTKHGKSEWSHRSTREEACHYGLCKLITASHQPDGTFFIRVEGTLGVLKWRKLVYVCLQYLCSGYGEAMIPCLSITLMTVSISTPALLQRRFVITVSEFFCFFFKSARCIFFSHFLGSEVNGVPLNTISFQLKWICSASNKNEL